jgi:hypothetical protein
MHDGATTGGKGIIAVLFTRYASGHAYLVGSCTVLTCSSAPLEQEKVLAQFASSVRGQGYRIFLCTEFACFLAPSTLKNVFSQLSSSVNGHGYVGLVRECAILP